ncbi:MAG: Gfo/Idh/MocA family oxidoreductase [Marmoricola sp.]
MSPAGDIADDRPIRVALIGYGLAGSAFHAPLITSTSGLELAAVMTSRDVPPGITRVASVAELERLDIDLVVVATPNDSHVPLAREALAAGAHVVVDKPLAVTAAEAQRLVSDAAAAGKLLTVFQNRRWDGDYLTLRDLIEDGRLGQVHRFESRFERWRPKVAAAWRESADAVLGGGLLLDLGTHLVDQAVQLFGAVDSVYAEIAAVRPGALVEDDVFLALQHANGVVSHLWMSAVAAMPGPRMRALGDRGAWLSAELDSQEAALRRGLTPRDPGFGENPSGLLDGESWPTRSGDYAAFYSDVVRALREGSPPPVDAEDAVGVLRLLEAARQAASSGSAVRIA